MVNIQWKWKPVTRLGEISLFGLLFVVVGKFFSRKVAQENGYFLGYFLKWPEFFNFNAIKAFSNPQIAKILEKIARFAQKFGKFWTFLEAQSIFSRHSLMNFVTLGMLLGTYRVAQTCQNSLKVPVFSHKSIGRNFGLLFGKFGLLFYQTVWSRCQQIKQATTVNYSHLPSFAFINLFNH